MYACGQSILHAKLVRLLELLGWVGSVRYGRWFSFARSLVRSLVRSVDALGEDQKSKAANTHLCTHEASFFLSSFFFSSFFSSPRILKRFQTCILALPGECLRVKATSSSSALTTTRRCTQGCAAVIRALRSSGFQRGGLAGRNSGSDGMIRDCGVGGTGSDVWA